MITELLYAAVPSIRMSLLTVLERAAVANAISWPLSEHLSRPSRDYGKVRRTRRGMRRVEVCGQGKPSRGDLGLCIRIYRCGTRAKRGLTGSRTSLSLREVRAKRLGRCR